MITRDSAQSFKKGVFGVLRPLRAAAVVEIGIFIAGALAIDHLFFDGTRFRSVPEHPFWVLVLLIAAQYGTAAALVAALASSLALLVGNIPPQAITQDRFTWLFEISRLPLLWFLAAVTFGELRMRHIRERERLRAEVEETARRERVVAAAYQRLNRAKEALETRAAAQLRTAVGLYEAARAMEKLDPAEVLVGVGKLIRSVINPEKFSLFLLKNGHLELAVEEGWTTSDDYPALYKPSSVIFQEIVARQRMLSVTNPEDIRTLAGAGMIAAALVAPDTGKVLGMLKIEKLGFLDLNFNNLNTLKVLCQWIGAAYENALQYQTARSESIVNTETELFAYGFLSRQLSLLRLLAQRIGFDVSMIIVRLGNSDEMTDQQWAEIPRAFSRAVAGILRKSDLAFDYQRTGTEFAIVLPATSASGARIVMEKLAPALDSELALYAPSARFSFGIQSIHEARAIAEEALELQNA